MKKVFFLIFPILLEALSPFDSPKPHSFDLSIFNTKKSAMNEQAVKNPKISCRYVCDKKVYKEQEIADAVSFYKSSKEYKFK
jgi:hypothetical protein